MHGGRRDPWAVAPTAALLAATWVMASCGLPCSDEGSDPDVGPVHEDGSAPQDGAPPDGHAEDGGPQEDAGAPVDGGDGESAPDGSADSSPDGGIDPCGCPRRPRGLYTRLGGAGSSADPAIDGALRLSLWAAINPSEGVFDFSRLDSALDALPPGQKAHLGVFTYGRLAPSAPDPVPSWLLDDRSVLRASDGQIAPTDPTYLGSLHAMVRALGEHYADDCRVCVVDAAGPTGRITWRGATYSGYSRAAMIDAWIDYVDEVAAAFPGRGFTLPIQGWNDGERSPEEVALAVIDHLASSGLAPRFSTFYEAWTDVNPQTTGTIATIEDHASSAGMGIGFQACGMIGPPRPGDETYCTWGSPETTLSNVFDWAFDRWHASFLEIDPRDAVSANRATLDAAHERIWAP